MAAASSPPLGPVERFAARRYGGATAARGDDETPMIRKLPSGQYRLYSREKNPATGKRRNLGTFPTREAAEKHEREIQYFKRH